MTPALSISFSCHPAARKMRQLFDRVELARPANFGNASIALPLRWILQSCVNYFAKGWSIDSFVWILLQLKPSSS
jgi:hypothetical protein